ncbi:MAG: efflux RND transporter periplasmic adaptor subunit [Phycisphaerae bacterium]|nr:efflux RND transporter periplasmic adaptor subunit [Phycisphaerae bacterium]
MAVRRPTFHEAWYRVADLRPRLMSDTHVYRQQFRGAMWYVIENRANNQFTRVSPEAYRFIGLMDGKRTVSEVWQLCNEQLGDDSPTQGEVIGLLGQLYTANLLFAEMTSDAEGMFNRYRNRVKRQVQGYLTNFLFVRVPLIDPDRFLNMWVGVFGKLFSKLGFLLWLAVLTFGGYLLLSDSKELVHQSNNVLSKENLGWLYLSFVINKVFHEFSHSFACKKFGRLNGTKGQVHTMGVMFLVFMPFPYMDASSAWAFRNKWHRVIVGSSGVMAELFVAGVAAVVWANTSVGVAHSIAYNLIFVASISALVFNGNPLLRFDAYYVLSDLVEIPNLAQRSKDYIYYLVKKYLWGIKNIFSSANCSGEKVWFCIYGPVSMAYRIFISVRILLFLNDRLPDELFLVVPVLAVMAVFGWGVVPVVKFFRYLLTNMELSRTRARAMLCTAGTIVAIVVGLFVVKLPYHCRVEGVVEPVRMARIYANSDGWVKDCLISGSEVDADGLLLVAENMGYSIVRKGLIAERDQLTIKQDVAIERGINKAKETFDKQIAVIDEKIGRVDDNIKGLKINSPLKGIWVSPGIENAKGAFLQKGQQGGIVVGLEEFFVRAIAGQNLAARLIENEQKEVEFRVKGMPEVTYEGQIDKIQSAGQEDLPSRALGYTAGGAVATNLQDPRGVRALEKYFEVRVSVKDDGKLMCGQRVIVRIELEDTPLAVQWGHSLRQLFQQRFQL